MNIKQTTLVLQRLYRGFAIATLLGTGICAAAPSAPTLQQVAANTHRVWVLIHGDVPFLIPAERAAGEGAALVTWGAVAGASSYQYRVAINGIWSDWQSVGAQLFANISASGYNIQVEVRACDSSGCSAAAVTTVAVSAWRNEGLCNPETGLQRQICTDSRYCTLNSVRDVTGQCSQGLVPCS